jgi:hypothetical protein
MGLADDCLKRHEGLRTTRLPYEGPWADCIALTLPGHEDFTVGGMTAAVDQLTRGPKSNERGRRLYDSTGVVAVDRLAAGMESLVTPQSEKWHGLKTVDPFSVEQTDEENEYFDKYRDYLFNVRYNPKSGFVTAHQRAMRMTVALGTGIVIIEDNLGTDGMATHRLPFRYRYLPITRVWLDRNAQGENDVLFWLEPMTARAMVQRYGEDGVPADVKFQALDPSQTTKERDVLHCIYPRTDRFRGKVGIQNAAFETAHIDVNTRHLLNDSTGGYYEFPAAVYHWSQTDGAYSESPVMFALAELKTLQSAGKSALRVAQNTAEPALAVAHDGLKVRLNQNPRAVNYGMVNPDNGQILVKPIVTGQLTQAFNEFMNGKREAVNDALYIRLFQIMVQNPQMTATEAMLRANEKGELLGPAGSRIQAGLSHMVDRETAILDRKGIYAPGSALAPPSSLANRDFGPQMTSPLDRMRRLPEALAMDQVIMAVAQVDAIAPDAKDNIDFDEYVRTKREILGAPSKMLRQKPEVDELRAAKQQQQAKMAEAMQAEQEGKATLATAEGFQAAAGVAQQHGPALEQMMTQGNA